MLLATTQHDRLIMMIKESITLMCKSTLMYSSELSVEGLLGITLDKRDVFLVNIKEIFQLEQPTPSVSSSSATDYNHVRNDPEVLSDDETAGKFQQEPARKVAKYQHRQSDVNREDSFRATPHREVDSDCTPSRVAFEKSLLQLAGCVDSLDSVAASASMSDVKFPAGIVIKEEVQDIDFGQGNCSNTSDSTVIRDARLSAAVNQSFSSAPFTSTPYHSSVYSSAVSPSGGDALDTRLSLPVKADVDSRVAPPDTTNGARTSQFGENEPQFGKAEPDFVTGLPTLDSKVELDFVTGLPSVFNSPSNRALVSDNQPHTDDNTYDTIKPDNSSLLSFDQWHVPRTIPEGVTLCWLEKLPKRQSPSTGKLVQVLWDCDVCSDRKVDCRRRSQWACGLCRRGVCPNECFRNHVMMRNSKFVNLAAATT